MSTIYKLLMMCILLATPVWAQDQEAYLLGPHDQIEVRVFREADLSTLARIQSDNSILMPVIGRVVVGGLTEQDAVKRIQQALIDGGVVQEPAVTLRISAYGSKRVAVLGYAVSPGTYYLDRTSTISDVLAGAGGAQVEGADFLYFTDYDPATGQSERIKLVIQDILGDGSTDLDRPMGNGDKIYIPRAPVFYIYGQVKAPGTYRLFPGMTAEQALATAGGVTEMGKASSLNFRSAQSEKMSKIKLGEKISANYVLFVPERFF